MRQPWFGIHLLVLIVIEIILMSHNGEGVNTSVAKQWSKRNTKNAGNMWSSDFRSDQSSEETDSSKTFGRDKRSRISKTGQTVDRNLMTKSENLWPSNDDGMYLQSNDPRSSVDSEDLQDPSLPRIIESLRGRDFDNRQTSNSVKTTEDRSVVTYVLEKVLSILCHIMRQMILQMEPFSSVSKIILRVLLQLINMVKSYVIGQEHSDPADPPRGTIQKIIDYFNPLKRPEDPKRPPQPNTEEKGIIGSLIDYFNPFKKTSESPSSNEPIDETLAVLETVMDLLKPLRSDHSQGVNIHSADKGWAQAHVNRLGNSETVQSPSPRYFDIFPNSDALEENTFDLFAPLIIQPPTNPPPHPLKSSYIRRRTREANACPKLPRNYHKAAGVHRAYKLNSSNLDWEGARLKCKTESAELAMPENQQQYDVMIDHAKRILGNPESRFHLGIQRLLHWTTVSGNPLTFEKWANRNVDEDTTEKRCAAMIVSDKVDGFNSESCSTQLPFMCEIIIPAECA